MLRKRGRFRGRLTLALATTMAIAAPAKAQDQAGPPLDPTLARILAVHNAKRAAVGSPPLVWNPQLAADAAAYVGQLAAGAPFVHAPREGRQNQRESLARAPRGSSPERLMLNWTAEEKNFIRGKLFPDVSSTGDWADVAHYTQIIWSRTTDIGCGTARGKQWDFLVCRYAPAGNIDGKPVLAADYASNGFQVGAGMEQPVPPKTSNANLSGLVDGVRVRQDWGAEMIRQQALAGSGYAPVWVYGNLDPVCNVIGVNQAPPPAGQPPARSGPSQPPATKPDLNKFGLNWMGGDVTLSVSCATFAGAAGSKIHINLGSINAPTGSAVTVDCGNPGGKPKSNADVVPASGKPPAANPKDLGLKWSAGDVTVTCTPVMTPGQAKATIRISLGSANTATGSGPASGSGTKVFNNDPVEPQKPYQDPQPAAPKAADQPQEDPNHKLDQPALPQADPFKQPPPSTGGEVM